MFMERDFYNMAIQITEAVKVHGDCFGTYFKFNDVEVCYLDNYDVEIYFLNETLGDMRLVASLNLAFKEMIKYDIKDLISVLELIDFDVMVENEEKKKGFKNV